MTNISTRPLIFLGTTREPQCTYRVNKYLDGYWTLQYMESGGVEIAYDDELYVCEGPWFWPAYPGPLTRFNVADGHSSWFHRHVGFAGAQVLGWIDAGIWLDTPQPAPIGRDYAVLFDEIIDQVKRDNSWGSMRAINLIERLLIELAEARSSVDREATTRPWLNRLLPILEGSSEVDVTLAEFAISEGMSLTTVRRKFKSAMGVSVHHYAIQTRVRRARKMLAETDIPLKAIAEELGYENVFFFSRQFRQHAGISPGKYRSAR